jgi:hypothetical protein
VLVKRWVPHYEQDFLWAHTRELGKERVDRRIVMIQNRHQGHSEQKLNFVRMRRARRPGPPRPGIVGYDSRGDNSDRNGSESSTLSAEGSTEDEKLSPEEAEKLMDKFLATFSSDGIEISGG